MNMSFPLELKECVENIMKYLQSSCAIRASTFEVRSIAVIQESIHIDLNIYYCKLPEVSLQTLAKV